MKIQFSIINAWEVQEEMIASTLRLFLFVQSSEAAALILFLPVVSMTPGSKRHS